MGGDERRRTNVLIGAIETSVVGRIVEETASLDARRRVEKRNRRDVDETSGRVVWIVTNR
jgi:hypothetical protein